MRETGALPGKGLGTSPETEGGDTRERGECLLGKVPEGLRGILVAQ